MLDIYPARERAEDFPGVTGLLVAEAAGRRRRRAAGRVDAGAREAEAFVRARAARRRPRAHARRRRRRRARPRARRGGVRRPRGVERRGAGAGARAPNLEPIMARLEPAALARARRPARSRSSGSALGWLWFRDSSFAGVERVAITGSGVLRGRRRCATRCEAAATGMSTLHVDRGRAARRRSSRSPRSPACASRPTSRTTLRDRGDRARAGREVEPAASRVPATGGGLLLRRRRADATCPSCRKAPLADGRVQRPRARSPRCRSPPPRRASCAPAPSGSGRAATGSTLDLRDGPDLIFGSAERRARRSGWRPRGCSPRTPRPARPTSTCGSRRWSPRAASGRSRPEPTPTPTVVPSNPQP